MKVYMLKIKYFIFFVFSTVSIQSHSAAIIEESDRELVEKFANIMADNKKLILTKRFSPKEIQSFSEALKANNTVTKLELFSTNIDSAGTQCLSEALKINNVLVVFDLGGNQIDSTGVRYISETLKSNRTLTKLYLGLNEIDSE